MSDTYFLYKYNNLFKKKKNTAKPTVHYMIHQKENTI